MFRSMRSFAAFGPARLALPVAGAALLGLGGCANLKLAKSVTVSSQDKAAAVLVTPTMAAPWSAVADSMAPKFAMTGETALTKVLPVTENIDERSLRAFSASLALGLPTSTSSATSSVTNTATQNSALAADGTVTNTGSSGATSNDSSTATRASGTAPTAPTGVPAQAAALTGAALSGTLGVDPVLQYKAANYLLQNIQLLNSELQYASRASCYFPYVVKLKLAVMPYQPRLGYSLHTRISFFNGDQLDNSTQKFFKESVEKQVKEGARPIQAIPATKPAPRGTASAGASDSSATEGSTSEGSTRAPGDPASPCTGGARTPMVIPMLAADDLQMAMRSRSEAVANQLGLALTFMTGGVGGSAGLNKLDQTMRAIQNRDISSALTVAREADNMLYVRIAPSNEASGQPVLVGQTYDIAVLLLVPKGYFRNDEKDRPYSFAPKIDINTYTEFRDARRGWVLPNTPPPNQLARLDRTVRMFMSDPVFEAWRRQPPEYRLRIGDRLGQFVEQGNYADFKALMSLAIETCTPPECPVAETAAPLSPMRVNQLWSAIGATLSDSPFKTASLELPVMRAGVDSPQDVFVMDDGKNNAVALIRNVVNTSNRGFVAYLSFKKQGSTATQTLPAQGIALDNASRTLTVTFPSFAKLGITPETDAKLVLGLSYCDRDHQYCPPLSGADRSAATEGDASDPSLPFDATIVSGKKEGADADFAFAPEQDFVITKDSAGSVMALLSKLAAGDTVSLKIRNARVTSLTDGAGAAIAPVDGAYTLAANGRYTLVLSNLLTGSTITLTATGKKAGKDAGSVTATVLVR